MDIDLNCVESFLALVDDLHVRRTAGSLHLSPSALTKRIQKLEWQLGARLIDRDADGAAQLTAAAVRFVPHARALMAEANAARQSVRAGSRQPQIRLGLSGQLSDHPEVARLPAVAADIRRDIPGASIQCVGIPYTKVASALLSGTIDVMWDISSTKHPDIEEILLHSFVRVGLVPLEHPFADADAVSVEEFADQPLLFDESVPSSWMKRFCLDDVRPMSDARLVPMDGRNATDVKNSLAMRAGVTVAPSYMAATAGPFLTTVDIVGVPMIQSVASRRRGDGRDSVIRLIEALRKLEPWDWPLAATG
ncbi:MAG: LysR family transcriptional regulator [Pseudolysinimonas sp.]